MHWTLSGKYGYQQECLQTRPTECNAEPPCFPHVAVRSLHTFSLWPASLITIPCGSRQFSWGGMGNRMASRLLAGLPEFILSCAVGRLQFSTHQLGACAKPGVCQRTSWWVSAGPAKQAAAVMELRRRQSIGCFLFYSCTVLDAGQVKMGFGKGFTTSGAQSWGGGVSPWAGSAEKWPWWHWSVVRLTFDTVMYAADCFSFVYFGSPGVLRWKRGMM